MSFTYSHIKSFVKRQGRISKAQHFGLSFLIDYCIQPEKIKDLKFNRNLVGKKLVLEIGFGMADNLIFNCIKYPNLFFIGVDVFLPGIGNAINNIRQNNLNNCLLFNGDVIQLLDAGLVFDRIQIFFPDPWPKKKHHKRRLINKEFLTRTIDNLKDKGILHIVTDWEDYAQVINKLISNHSNYSHKITNEQLVLSRCQTKFEYKAKLKDHKIFEFLYQRI